MRKPAFCICENKDADQLRGNREADQRLCFRYTDSTISLLPKCEISSLQPSSVAVQPGLCGTWSETPFSQNEAHLILYQMYSLFLYNLLITDKIMFFLVNSNTRGAVGRAICSVSSIIHILDMVFRCCLQAI